MLMMNKRGKDVNWSKLANAPPKPKRLHLEEDDCGGLFHCPMQICNHDEFTTQRGCRKHVKNKRSWYYYFGKKGSELEIDVRSRLSGNSASSEDQNGSKTDTSSNDEGETIAETPPERLSGVPRLKRENAFIATDFPARKKSLMFTPEEDNHLKAGIERHGYGQWKAILRDPEYRFQEGRTANSLLSRAARRFGSLSKLS